MRLKRAVRTDSFSAHVSAVMESCQVPYPKMRAADFTVRSRAFPINARNFDRLQATPIRSRTLAPVFEPREPIMSGYRGAFRAIAVRAGESG